MRSTALDHRGQDLVRRDCSNRRGIDDGAYFSAIVRKGIVYGMQSYIKAFITWYLFRNIL